MAGGKTEQAEQPPADERADNPQHDIGKQAEACTASHFAGEKTGDRADDQPSDKSMLHVCPLPWSSIRPSLC